MSQRLHWKFIGTIMTSISLINLTLTANLSRGKARTGIIRVLILNEVWGHLTGLVGGSSYRSLCFCRPLSPLSEDEESSGQKHKYSAHTPTVIPTFALADT